MNHLVMNTFNIKSTDKIMLTHSLHGVMNNLSKLTQKIRNCRSMLD